jgi:hypothetical protein
VPGVLSLESERRASGARGFLGSRLPLLLLVRDARDVAGQQNPAVRQIATANAAALPDSVLVFNHEDLAMKGTQLLSIAVAVGCCISAAQAGEDTAPRIVCRSIHAELHELFTTDNCTSPVGFCAAGTIDGNFGLEGTTFFSVDNTGFMPPESPGITTFVGSFTITTDFGTLTLRESGMSYPRRGNPDGGRVATIDEVLSGTGRFAGATGILFFHGRNGRGLPSDVEVTGDLCVPMRHRHHD